MVSENGGAAACDFAMRERRLLYVFFFQAEDGIRDLTVTGVQTCALPISPADEHPPTASCPARPEQERCRARKAPRSFRAGPWAAEAAAVPAVEAERTGY